MNYEFKLDPWKIIYIWHLSRNDHGKDEKTEINFNVDVLANAAVIVCIGSFSN